MVTHSIKAASHAKRVLFIKDGNVFHELYKGQMSNEEMFQKNLQYTCNISRRGGWKCVIVFI